MGAPYAMLGGAAGAHEGLRELLARRMEEAQFAEQQRRALAQEGLEGRQIDETAAYRKAVQASTEQERLRDETYRRDALAQGKELSLSQLAQAKAINELTERGRGERAADAERGRNERAAEMGQLRIDLARLIPRSEMLVPVQQPDGTTIYAPRSQAQGLTPPLPVDQRNRMQAYRQTLDLIGALEEQGAKTNWGGLGGFGAGRIRGMAFRNLGAGNPEEEVLRNMLDQLKARASFQEGGKQFTATEAALLNNFLAQVSSNPLAAQTSLRSFKESAQRAVGGMTAGVQPMPSHDRQTPYRYRGRR